jgi:hypothetical protein
MTAYVPASCSNSCSVIIGDVLSKGDAFGKNKKPFQGDPGRVKIQSVYA